MNRRVTFFRRAAARRSPGRDGAAAFLMLLFASLTGAAQRAAAPSTLRIGGPDFEPLALVPSTHTTKVTVRAMVAGAAVAPAVLLLEEVTAAGRSRGIIAELKDDAKAPDATARDRRYATTLELGSRNESERFFRIRVSPAENAVVTRPATFAVTTLPIGFPQEDPGNAVPTRPGFSDALPNTVSFASKPGVGPTRIRAVVANTGADLGTTLEIVGYSPALNSYIARFTGEKTFDAVQRIADALRRHAEIGGAGAAYVGRPAANQWWLKDIHVDTLRSRPGASVVPTQSRSSVVVGVIEVGVDAGFTCNPGTLLESNCVSPHPTPPPPPPAPPTVCVSPTLDIAQHSMKVGTLIAGVNTYDWVEGGVAPKSMLLPLRVGTHVDVANALQCAADQAVSVANMSLEFALPEDQTKKDTPLYNGVCYAACHNVLMVAASGDHACPVMPTLPYPGAYAKSADTCDCGGGKSVTIGDFMLSVGATTETGALGEDCTPTNIKSMPGDMYAPGWDIPGSDVSDGGPGDYGTSWAAPLVAGCGAIIAAVETWAGGQAAWDAAAAESRLRESGPLVTFNDPGARRLDCLAAVYRPYDVVFLLDASGSMGGPAVSTPTPTRWDVLKSSVSDFVTTMSITAPATSRAGVTLFSTSFPTMTKDPLVTGMQTLDAALAAGLQAPNGPLDLTPSGGTPMGSGLQAAVAELTTTSRPRIVVLFTDGEQNVPRYVHGDGCDYSDDDPGNPPSNPSSIAGSCPGTTPGSLKIVPVGIGSPSGVYLTTLQNLAANHRGTLLITDNAATFTSPTAACAGNIDAAFECAIAPTLYGNSLQMVESAVTPLLPNRDLLRFEINSGVTGVVIKLRAQQADFDFGRFTGRLQVTRNGADVTPYFRKTPGAATHSVLLSTHFLLPAGTALPALASEGAYVVRLLPNPVVDDLLTRLREPITVLAFADEHRLDMRWELAPSLPRAGQPFRPRVTLRWAGEPITDALVTALVFKPGDDLGDVLANNPTRVDPSSGPDAVSPGWQKYDLLWRTDAAFRARLAPNQNVLQLVHRGDGVYDAPFDPGDVSGVYQIVYEVHAGGGASGVIQREGAQSAYVRFGTIDFGRSLVSRVIQGDTVTLTLKPVATNGRLVGPGQGSIFGVSGGAAKITSVTDHQDGTYTLVLSADPRAKIEIRALGERVYTGRADFEQRKKS